MSGPVLSGPVLSRTALGEPLLEISGLRVDYGMGPDAVHAVTAADLVLHRGEVLGLAGESGSGKSTLVMAATRLLRPPGVITGGEVLLHEEDGAVVDLLEAGYGTLRVLRWSEVSLVLQSAMNALNPVLTIRSQLADAISAHVPGTSAKQRHDRAVELLEMVGISGDRLGSYPHELSGGMRQRVMIAMALALRPQIVIMDEPTTALDVVTQREILEELKDLRDEFGFAILFITHDLSLLIEIADSIAVMYAGRLVERAGAAALFRAPRHPYTLGLLGSFPPLHGPRMPMTGIPGSPPDLRLLPTGCVFHPRCRFAFDKCEVEDPPLEQVGADRLAACWKLHAESVPPELAMPEPGPGALAVPSALATENGATEDRAAAEVIHIAAREARLAAAGPEAIAASPEAAEDGAGHPVLEVPMLEVQGLTKHFPVHGAAARRARRVRSQPRPVVHAVDDVSLSLAAAQVTAVVGESGSGKSTLARVLARLTPPTSGEVLLNGRRVSHAQGRLSYAKTVQMVLQDPFASLNPVHDVRYHLSRPFKVHGLAGSGSDLDAKIAAVLERVSLTPADAFMRKYPHELSGGQRQRVAIARALAVEPRVLLADEPVSMLDVSIRLGVLNLLGGLRDTEQLAILYITHDIASARYLADKIVVMYAGQVVESGPAVQVTDSPSHPYTQLLLSAAPDPDRTTPVTLRGRGSPPSAVSPPSGCRFRTRCPYAMPICEQQPPAFPAGSGHVSACWLLDPGGTSDTGAAHGVSRSFEANKSSEAQQASQAGQAGVGGEEVMQADLPVPRAHGRAPGRPAPPQETKPATVFSQQAGTQPAGHLGV
jgi:peptide/nickel transport system ATP-binding protein